MTAIVRVVIAYVPVLHAGYVEFFKQHAANGAQVLFVLSDEVLETFPHLRKDLRRLRNGMSMRAINALGIFEKVVIGDAPALAALAAAGRITVVMPDEAESRAVAAAYLMGCDVVYDPVFLRWNRQNVEQQQEVEVDRVVQVGDLAEVLVRNAFEEAAKSADWWRQVGAVVSRRGEVLLAGYNQHVPDDRRHLFNGDPRSLFSRGVAFDLSTVLHAEANVIAQAARNGVSLQGCDLFVTDFPCPACAKLVAYSGLRSVHFVRGYAVLDGMHALRDQQVEIVQVQLPA